MVAHLIRLNFDVKNVRCQFGLVIQKGDYPAQSVICTHNVLMRQFLHYIFTSEFHLSFSTTKMAGHEAVPT